MASIRCGKILGPFILIAAMHIQAIGTQPENVSWCSGKNEKYFDTRAFLSNVTTVRKALIEEEQFTPVTFTSKDNVCLSGLLRICKDAPFSIIVCSGFFPGNKEGMASLVPMLPRDCNILLMDARGHGESKGRFWSCLPSYGKHEYQDVIGAIDFMHKKADVPLFIHAVCIGTFHATRALLSLEKEQLTEKNRIKGLIFDSGLGSIVQAAHIPKNHIKNKVLTSALIRSFYPHDTKEQVKQRLLYRASWACISPIVSVLEWCITPFLKKSDPQINLFDQIKKLNTHVLYIHSHDDTYTPIAPIKTLAKKTPHKTCWWLNTSEHTLHHIKHKEEYRSHLLAFLSEASDTKK